MNFKRTKQLLFVALFWAGSFLVLISLPAFLISSENEIAFVNEPFPNNEFGPFTLTDYDNFQTFKVHFDKLASFSGKFSLFRTSAYKEIIFTNLEIVVATGEELNVVKSPKIHKKKNSSKKVVAEEPNRVPLNIASLFEQMKKSFKKNIQSISGEQGACQIPFFINFPNCENAARFVANGFKFSWYDNTNIKYTIESKRAICSLLDSSDIQLQGHVVLKANDKILESNSVYWDVQKNLFTIQGAYVITNQDHKKHGRNISVDPQLNVISTTTSLNVNGEKVCLIENQ